MDHAESQRLAREAKAERKRRLAELEEQQRYKAACRAREVSVTIDHDDMLKLLISDLLLPEDTVKIETIYPNGKNAWLVRAVKK